MILFCFVDLIKLLNIELNDIFPDFFFDKFIDFFSVSVIEFCLVLDDFLNAIPLRNLLLRFFLRIVLVALWLTRFLSVDLIIVFRHPRDHSVNRMVAAKALNSLRLRVPNEVQPLTRSSFKHRRCNLDVFSQTPVC